MAEGVEFLLKLDAQIDGALKMIRTITDVEKGLGRAESAINRTEHATRAAGEGHKKHATGAQHLEGALHRLIHSGMEPFLERAKRIAEFEFIRRGIDALLEAPGELIEKIKELGAEIINVAANTQAMNLSLKFAMGAGPAREFTEWAEKAARVINYTDDEIKRMGLDFAKVNLKGEGLTDAIRASADLAALSGDRVGGLASAVEAISRMQRTGSIAARSLGGFGITEDDFRRLPQYASASKKALEKLMQDGSITSGEVFKIITLKTGKALGGAAADMGDTLQHKLIRLKDLPDQYFQKFADSPIMGRLSERFDSFIGSLDPDSDRGKRIFKALEGAFGRLIGIVEKVDFEKWATNIERVINLLAAVVRHIGLIKDVAKNVLNPGSFIGEKIGSALGIGDKIGSAIDTLEDQDVDTGFRMQGMIDKAHAGGQKVGEAIGEGIGKGIQGKLDYVTGMGAALGGAATKGTREEVGVKSPSTVYEMIGYQTTQGFVLGQKRGKNEVSAESALLVEAPRAVPYSPPVSSASPKTMSISLGGITVHVHADDTGDSKQVAETIADHLREQVPAMIAATFQKLQLEMGAA